MGTLIAAAPLVTLQLDTGGRMNLPKGAPVPHNADPDDVARLIEEGFLVVEETVVEEETVDAEGDTEADDQGGDAPEGPTTVAGILEEVAGDPEKAAAALDAELATEKPRTTLVKALEEIIDAEGDPEAVDQGGD